MGGIFSSDEAAGRPSTPNLTRHDSDMKRSARGLKASGSKKKPRIEAVEPAAAAEAETIATLELETPMETPQEPALEEAPINDIENNETTGDAPSAFKPTKGTKEATAVLFKQFQELLKSKPENEGYRVELADDNIYQWRISLFDFPSTCQIHDDLKMYHQARPDREEAVVVEAVFPPNYPSGPPFMRILYPRFHQYTGHITIGGSICVKELTLSGWNPEFKLTQFVIMIRNLLMEGGALVDMSNPKIDYSIREAQEAFFRVASQHGWKVS